MVTRTCKTQQKSDAFDIDDEARDAEIDERGLSLQGAAVRWELKTTPTSKSFPQMVQE